MLYDDYTYNPNLQSASYYAWGEGACFDLDVQIDNKASSLRYTGAPDGYKYDTFNVYEGDFFQVG